MSPKKEPCTALAVTTKDSLVKLDKIATDYMLARADQNNPFTLAMLTADAITEMRDLITPEMMKGVMGIMNTQLGSRPTFRRRRTRARGTPSRRIPAAASTAGRR